MKRLTGPLSAAFTAIALLTAVITTAGCDDDKIWDTASNTYGQYLLVGLVLPKSTMYTITVHVDTIPDGGSITIGITDVFSFTINSNGTYTYTPSLKPGDIFSTPTITQANITTMTCSITDSSIGVDSINITVACE